MSDIINDINFSAEALLALTEMHMNKSLDDHFTENWNLSQFWYDQETSDYLCNQVIKTIDDNAKIACISCPTLYISLKKRQDNDKSFQIYLFEFDNRFAKYGNEFIFYNYKEPLSVKTQFEKKYFDLVIADPPFLSEECLQKYSQTILYLAKDKVILNTGSILEQLVKKYLQLNALQHFIPKHKNNLGNRFLCYTNFDFKK